MRLSDVGQTVRDWKLGLLIVGTVLVIVLLWGGDAIRPMSLQRAGVRDVKPLPTPVWLMAAFMVVLTPSLVAAWAVQLEWVTGGDGDSLRAIAAPQGLAYLAGIAVALGLVVMTKKAAPGSGCKLDWIDAPVGFGLLLLVLPIVLLSGELAALVHHSLVEEDTPKIAHPLLQKIVDSGSDPWGWVLIGVAVIGAAVVEEIAFRGFLQSAMLRLTGHAWVAVIVTAAVFGTIHGIGAEETRSPWYAALTVGVLGLCCGGAFERTKRLGVPIAMHAAFNAGNVAVALWLMD